MLRDLESDDDGMVMGHFYTTHIGGARLGWWKKKRLRPGQTLGPKLENRQRGKIPGHEGGREMRAHPQPVGVSKNKEGQISSWIAIPLRSFLHSSELIGAAAYFTAHGPVMCSVLACMSARVWAFIWETLSPLSTLNVGTVLRVLSWHLPHRQTRLKPSD